MSGISTDPIDIQKYKCVPLDLLRNVSANNKVQFETNNTSVTLKNLKDEQEESVNRQNSLSGKPLNAEMLENIILGITIFFFAIFILIILFYGFLNFRTYGWKAFQLPEIFRNLPVIAFSSIVFGIIGFLVGYLLNR